MCCSVLCVFSTPSSDSTRCVAVWRSALQCVAVWRSALQYVVVCCSVRCNVLLCVLQCVVHILNSVFSLNQMWVSYSVVQCAAACAAGGCLSSGCPPRDSVLFERNSSKMRGRKSQGKGGGVNPPPPLL